MVGKFKFLCNNTVGEFEPEERETPRRKGWVKEKVQGVKSGIMEGSKDVR